jgi:8-hydroxy-5-deazaflavin:NADPH oxidoreductase
MQIGILGSGMVGQTVGAKLVELGHDVVIGTRDPAKISEWLQQVGGSARAGSGAEAAAHGEIVVNATAGTASLDALNAAGAENLRGKILIDIANPLQFVDGKPTLTISNTDSLAEQIQRAFPDTRVVKTLNTLNAPLMVNPAALADGDHTIFVSGDDADAKAQVIDLLRDGFGWRNIVDLGDISTARGTEALLLIWVQLWGALGTPSFNFKIVQ